MASFQVLALGGNLTRDPELRVTPKGTAICQFGIAVNRKWKGEDGQSQEEVMFIDCEAWGKTAETVAKYCVKGGNIMVEGRLKLDQWEDKTSGQKRSKHKVVVESFTFLGSKKDGDEPGALGREAPTERHTPPPARHAPPSRAPDPTGIDEDVPF